MSRQRIIFLLVGTAIASGALLYGLHTYHNLNQPVAGAVTIEQTAPIPTSEVNLSPLCTTGTYIFYCRPKGLATQPAQKLQSPEVQLTNFTAKDTQSWLLGIEIDKGTGNLNNDSAYTLRINNPGEYAESQIVLNGQTIYIMQDTYADGFSKVAFLTHGSYTATLSLVGDDQNGIQPLTDAFMMVLRSWRWQ